ncbi:MAG TPA: OmpA family protein [Noviherbaspirillum sp.]
MKNHSYLRSMPLAFAFVLVACAQTEQAVDAQLAMPTQEQPLQIIQAEVHAPSSTPETVVSEYDTMNPVPIEFETLSVRLDAPDTQILKEISERALAAERITIRGYCDRQEVNNAKEVAIERGAVVRDELVRLGVDPKIIRIRYSTESAGKHAAEIELHDDA